MPKKYLIAIFLYNNTLTKTQRSRVENDIFLIDIYTINPQYYHNISIPCYHSAFWSEEFKKSDKGEELINNIFSAVAKLTFKKGTKNAN